MIERVKVPMFVASGLLLALAAAVAFSATIIITVRPAEHEGEPAAQVVIEKTVVMELLTSAAGYSPQDRAEIVADRVREALQNQIQAANVHVAPVPSGEGLYITDHLIIAVEASEAGAHRLTPRQLADEWRGNIVRALKLEQQGAAPPAAGDAPAAAAKEVDWTGTAQKWAPIFSLESGGAYIGAAQIAGPPAQLAKVKGVAELRLNFQNFARIYAYIPVSSISLTKLDRVQGVSVWATGDIRLVEF